MNQSKFFFIYIVLYLTLTPGMSQELAFPGAEGYGSYATGGRGGQVMVVSNLLDDGPGSLRQAINQKFPRIIVFEVSGTIALESDLEIHYGNLTIAGQSAPGDGITLKNYPLKVKAGNVIIRYLRCRLGDEYDVQDDAITVIRQRQIMIDHCSFSWATDECATFYDNDSSTVQYCIISESLNHSVHEKGEHGYGGIWGGRNASFHHNLFAHHKSRNPRFNGARYHHQPELERVDFRNNVIYNWQENNSYAGEEGNHNLVANYYQPGPATVSKKDKILDPFKPYGKFYLSENVLAEDPEVTADNWLGVNVPESVIPDIRLTAPLEVSPVLTTSAVSAREQVLLQAGASRKRDPVDVRLVEEVRMGTATFGTGIINTQLTVGGWPVLQNAAPAPDTDRDGMPDSWEIQRGLNPENPNDASRLILGSWYTNIECYLNELAQPEVPHDTTYTVRSTFQKVKKHYPEGAVSPVYPISSEEISERMELVYRICGFRQLTANLFAPVRGGLHPGIVMVHGGGWRAGDKSLMTPMAQRFAAAGYVVMAPEYRLSQEAAYPAAVYDLKAAIRWMRAHSDSLVLDPEHIAILGCSAGGQLATLIGTTNGDGHFDELPNPGTTSAVQAIVDIDGVLAFLHPLSEESRVAAEWLGGTSAEIPEIWKEASALTHTDQQTPPTLFLTSKYPRFTAGEHEYRKKLKDAGIYTDLHQFADAPHSFWLLQPWFEPTVQEVIAFLNRVWSQNPQHNAELDEK